MEGRCPVDVNITFSLCTTFGADGDLSFILQSYHLCISETECFQKSYMIRLQSALLYID